MRTFSVTLITILATLTACGPESIELDSIDVGSPDRITFVADETDTDETEGEETGDAGMDSAEPLPDAGVPEQPEQPFKCCTCESMECIDWDDNSTTCEADFAAAIGQATAWCELDVFGGVSACAAACE